MSRIGKMPVVVPAGVEVKIGADVIEVKGPKGVRLPEPYKGKGIKYTTETIRRKVGKSGGKK